MKTRTRTRIALGIYQDQSGLAATVKVGRVQRERRFPTGSDLRDLKYWQGQTRAELQRAHAPIARALPHQAWTGMRPSPTGWCYLYIVRSGDRVKIGRTSDPIQRLRGLQTAHPDTLASVLTIPAHVAIEAAIHVRFAYLRERGEWFRLDADLVAFIQALAQGLNPIALLWETP